MATPVSALEYASPRPNSVMDRQKLLRRRSSSVGPCLSSREKMSRTPRTTAEEPDSPCPRLAVNLYAWRTVRSQFRLGSGSSGERVLPLESARGARSRSSTRSSALPSPCSTKSCVDLQAVTLVQEKEFQDLVEALKMSRGGTLTVDKFLSGKTKGGLTVQGAVISPAPDSEMTDDLVVLTQTSDLGVTSHPSSAASGNDDRRSVASGDAYDVLQSLVNVNQTLENQLATLRLRLDVETKQHRSQRAELAGAKTKLLKDKEKELDGLKDSLAAREERIAALAKSREEKDKQIDEKMAEIERLRLLMERAKTYAEELGERVKHLKIEKRHLESDAIYREQSQEKTRLKKELHLLRERLVSMETELKRARNIIEQQSSRISELDSDNSALHAKFMDDLAKVSRAMRREEERMREVMKQNQEEIRNLREQNQEMHDDVREIKDFLLRGRTPQPQLPQPSTAVDNSVATHVTVKPPPSPRVVHTPSKATPPTNRRSLEQLSANIHRSRLCPLMPSRGSNVKTPHPPPGPPAHRGTRQGIAGLPPFGTPKGAGPSRLQAQGRGPSVLGVASSKQILQRK